MNSVTSAATSLRDSAFLPANKLQQPASAHETEPIAIIVNDVKATFRKTRCMTLKQ
jgi:hypothetical protein